MNAVEIEEAVFALAEEEVAKPDLCKGFDVFRPLFQSVQKECESGARRTIKFKDNAEVSHGVISSISVGAIWRKVVRTDQLCGWQGKRLQVPHWAF